MGRAIRQAAYETAEAADAVEVCAREITALIRETRTSGLLHALAPNGFDLSLSRSDWQSKVAIHIEATKPKES